MKINIKDMPLDERPREKMMTQGAAALSDAELLAILIGSGNAEETAVGLMQRVMYDCGFSLNTLGRMTIDELCKRYKGIGEAKAISILAACELGSRRRREEVLEKQTISDSSQAYEYFASMRDLPIEECHVLMLRQNNSIIGEVMVSRGGLTGTAVDVREVARYAIVNRAASIILCHNHPSGNLRPSREDDSLTRRVGEACRLIDVRLMDHVIVSESGYYSYREQGKL